MIGTGAYSLSDVARLTNTPPATVRSWFKWRPDKRGLGPLFKSDLDGIGGDYAVSFLDLIDTYVAGFFRAREVHPTVIRRAYTKLQTKLGTPHPFAHADLCAGDGRIIVETENTLSDAINDEKWFSQMRHSLDHIDYEATTRVAARWAISRGVIVDPQVGFGKPVVQHTGVTTFVLANQFLANKSDSAIVAELFAVTEEDVLNAVAFEMDLRKRHAA